MNLTDFLNDPKRVARRAAMKKAEAAHVAHVKTARARPNVSFTPRPFIKLRTLFGTLRLTRFGLVPIEAKAQLALMRWLGIEATNDALMRFEDRLSAVADSARAKAANMDSAIAHAGADIEALRADLDADQTEYATNRAEDLKRLNALEADVATLAKQGVMIVNSLNTATMLCAAWREVPLLKAAEQKAKAQAMQRQTEREERIAEIATGTVKNGRPPRIVTDRPPETD